jgi:hypothetical protein
VETDPKSGGGDWIKTSDPLRPSSAMEASSLRETNLLVTERPGSGRIIAISGTMPDPSTTSCITDDLGSRREVRSRLFVSILIANVVGPPM